GDERPGGRDRLALLLVVACLAAVLAIERQEDLAGVLAGLVHGRDIRQRGSAWQTDCVALERHACYVRSMIAVVGGPCPLGSGLARRLAAAGEHLIIGSRDAARAGAAAAAVCAAVPGPRCEGAENLAAVGRADRVVLALPGAALPGFLDRAAPSLAGKLLIDV